MKKFLKIGLLTCALGLALSSNVFAAKDIYLVVDGKKIETDAPAFIEADRTLVPVRFISEALGYKIDWKADERKVVITKDDAKDDESKIMELIIDKDMASLYDVKENKKEVKLDVPAKIVKDRTFVPVRFISENFGTKANWDKENQVVVIGDESKYNKEEIAKLRAAEKQETPKAKVEKNNKTDKKAVDFSGTYIYTEGLNSYILFVRKADNKVDYTVKLDLANLLTGEQNSIDAATIKMNGSTSMGKITGPKTGAQFIEGEDFEFNGPFLTYVGRKFFSIDGGSEMVTKADGKVYIDGKLVSE